MSLLYFIVMVAILFFNRHTFPLDLAIIWGLVTITASAFMFILEEKKFKGDN